MKDREDLDNGQTISKTNRRASSGIQWQRSRVFTQCLIDELILIVGLNHSATISTEIAKNTNNINATLLIELFYSVAQSDETTRATDTSTRTNKEELFAKSSS